MGFWQRLGQAAQVVRGVARVKGNDTDYWPTSSGGIAGILSGIGKLLGISAQTNLERYTGWVYSCIRAMSEDFVKVELKLKRKMGDGDVEDVEEDHPAWALLENPNPLMAYEDLAEGWVSYKELDGNCFWILDFGGKKPGSSDPIAIYPVRPDMCTPVPDPNDKFNISGYLVQIGNKKLAFEREEVIHSKSFNPLGGLKGVGTLSAALMAVDMDLYASVWNKKYFENGAQPDYALIFEQTLDPEMIERIKAEWAAAHQGVDNAHKMSILHGNLKDIKPLTVNARDMEFIEMKRMSRDEILGIFRTPKTALGITEDVNRANAEATDYIFAERNTKPKLRRFVKMLNKFYLPLFKDSEGLYFTFSDPTPENREIALQEDAQLVQVGVMSVNEIRARRGLDDIGENGDQLYMPLNLLPVGATTDGAKSVKGNKKKPSRPAMKTKSLLDQITNVVKNSVKESSFESRGQMIWDGMVKRTENWEKVYITSMKAVFAKQEKEVLRNLASAVKSFNAKTKAVDTDKLFDAKKAVGILIDLGKKVDSEIYKAEGQEALDFLGLEDDFEMDDNARKQLKDQIEKFSKGVTETTINALADSLNKGIAAGEGIPDLTRRVKEVYNYAETYRAARVARSETIQATNTASQIAWKQSGVVSGKIWYTALDERTCEYCDEMHGEEIDLDENFFDEGDTAGGRDGGSMELDYRDIGEPPLHADCRCTLVPVIKSRSVAGTITKDLDLPEDEPAPETKAVEPTEEVVPKSLMERKLDEQGQTHRKQLEALHAEVKEALKDGGQTET